MNQNPAPTYAPSTAGQTAATSPKRWIGGVISTLAGRTGVSVGLIRAGWVGVVLMFGYAELPLLAWIPILTYAACWFTLNKRAVTATPATQVAAPVTAPADAPGLAGWQPQPFGPPVASQPAPAYQAPPAQPKQDAGTTERPHLKDFVQYLWANQPTPQPTYTCDLTGVVLSGLQFPGTRDPGYYATRMPFGKVYVYPDYLVFLTELHNPVGRVPELSRCLPVLLDAWRAIGFWRPIRLATTVYSKVTKEELDQLRKPLGNPNTIIVPISQIRGISTRRYVFIRYLVVHTTTRDIMLSPNTYLGMLAGLALPFLFLRNVRINAMGAIGLTWEKGLVAALEQAAGRYVGNGQR